MGQNNVAVIQRRNIIFLFFLNEHVWAGGIYSILSVSYEFVRGSRLVNSKKTFFKSGLANFLLSVAFDAICYSKRTRATHLFVLHP